MGRSPSSAAEDEGDRGTHPAHLRTEKKRERDHLESRCHPHRLDREMYQLEGHPIFVTIRARREIAALHQAETATVLLEVLRRAAVNRDIELHAYCLMPDHIHLVTSVSGPNGDMAEFIRYFKREAARVLLRPGMWQRSYWDRHARRDEDLRAMMEYVLANPVRRGYCESWEEWPYSAFLSYPE